MNLKMQAERPLIVIGGGGHARVLISALLRLGLRVLGFADKGQSQSHILGIPYLGQDEAVLELNPAEVLLINGVGSAAAVANRVRVYDWFRRRGYAFGSVLDPRAIVVSETRLSEGVQVMAGAVVQTGVVAHENCIINTGALVDHDCVLEAHAHIAPGAVLCGDVHVGTKAHIGAGATVIQGVRIGSGSIVGAGAVVLSDVPNSCTVAGVPARSIRQKA